VSLWLRANNLHSFELRPRVRSVRFDRLTAGRFARPPTAGHWLAVLAFVSHFALIATGYAPFTGLNSKDRFDESRSDVGQSKIQNRKSKMNGPVRFLDKNVPGWVIGVRSSPVLQVGIASSEMGPRSEVDSTELAAGRGSKSADPKSENEKSCPLRRVR
jgi:hypothetical protein